MGSSSRGSPEDVTEPWPVWVPWTSRLLHQSPSVTYIFSQFLLDLAGTVSEIHLLYPGEFCIIVPSHESVHHANPQTYSKVHPQTRELAFLVVSASLVSAWPLSLNGLCLPLTLFPLAREWPSRQSQAFGPSTQLQKPEHRGVTELTVSWPT